MARPISRGVLSFGLVSIPVELYSAIEDHNIPFHLLHKNCGSRVRNQLFCPICKVVIERDELREKIFPSESRNGEESFSSQGLMPD
jgi:non-homologous end joining protein Ku